MVVVVSDTSPVRPRYVKFKIPPKRILGVTEVQALHSLRYELFDMRITLPDEPIAPPTDPLQTGQRR